MFLSPIGEEVFLTQNSGPKRDWGFYDPWRPSSWSDCLEAFRLHGHYKRVMLKRVMLKKICTFLFYDLISHMNAYVFMSYNFIGGFIYEND